ncbi:hypothetical protein, partial [Luteococcus sediminum]
TLDTLLSSQESGATRTSIPKDIRLGQLVKLYLLSIQRSNRDFQQIASNSSNNAGLLRCCCRWQLVKL